MTATVVGTPGMDTINGTSGDDVIVGLAGSDRIRGRGGNDVICGGLGRDQLVGGGGDDTVYGQNGRDDLAGRSGNDTLSGGAGSITSFRADAGDDDYQADSVAVTVDFGAAPGPLSVDLGAGTTSGWGSDKFDFGDAHVRVGGSNHSDTFVGSERGEAYHGRLGFDTVDGKGGDDDLNAAQGVILGGDGDDVLRMTPVRRIDSTAKGGRGNDHVVQRFDQAGPSGEFKLAGGSGVDHFAWTFESASDGAHPFTFNMTTGSLHTRRTDGNASGFETLLVGYARVAGRIDIVGTAGPNVIEIASGGRVTVHGRAGDDVIEGSLEDDTLVGGPGDDTADGNKGRDTCTSIEHPSRCEILHP